MEVGKHENDSWWEIQKTLKLDHCDFHNDKNVLDKQNASNILFFDCLKFVKYSLLEKFLLYHLFTVSVIPLRIIFNCTMSGLVSNTYSANFGDNRFLAMHGSKIFQNSCFSWFSTGSKEIYIVFKCTYPKLFNSS